MEKNNYFLIISARLTNIIFPIKMVFFQFGKNKKIFETLQKK